jgi:hypothetical protein
MPIRDALWACPFCHAIDSIRTVKRREACSRCAATFEPGPGATIVAGPSGGPAWARSVEEWEGDLPALDEAAAAGHGPVSAVLRRASAPRPVHADGGLLGFAERFGPRIPATLEIAGPLLRILPVDGTPEEWQLAAVTAVQPSSSSVQLRRRDGALISLAFPDGSVRLWEARLQLAVRSAYRAAGRGEILEFHPTIRSR